MRLLEGGKCAGIAKHILAQPLLHPPPKPPFQIESMDSLSDQQKWCIDQLKRYYRKSKKIKKVRFWQLCRLARKNWQLTRNFRFTLCRNLLASSKKSILQKTALTQVSLGWAFLSYSFPKILAKVVWKIFPKKTLSKVVFAAFLFCSLRKYPNQALLHRCRKVA